MEPKEIELNIFHCSDQIVADDSHSVALVNFSSCEISDQTKYTSPKILAPEIDKYSYGVVLTNVKDLFSIKVSHWWLVQ